MRIPQVYQGVPTALEGSHGQGQESERGAYAAQEYNADAGHAVSLQGLTCQSYGVRLATSASELLANSSLITW